jgi:hypothetical protein
VKSVATALAGASVHGLRELEGLRRRLAGAGGASQDAVILDFLEDELRESRRALGEISDYLDRVRAMLRDPMTARQQLHALASHFRPAQELEYLEATLGRLRRRLAQVSGRLPDGR